MKKVSLIVPCYNEQESLPLFYEEAILVTNELPDFEFEFIIVDDGSKDDTLAVIKTLRERDKRVKLISFSRNFGKEAGMYAGLQAAKGEYVGIMDADMQDPPKLLPEMLEDLESGEYDSVATRRSTREGEPLIRSFFARMFYRLINKISNADLVDGARDFRLMNRKMADAVLSISEYNRFSKGIFGWVGFQTKWISFTNVNRVAGETKWSFWKLFLYSLEGITAFSTIPLAISSIMGVLMCLFAFAAILVIILKTLIWGDPVGGWPSMTSIMLLIGGIQLFCIGILGQYLSKTYLETKKRPIYIAKERKLD